MSLWSDLMETLGTTTGDILSGAAGLAATGYAVNQGKQDLGDIRADLMSRSGVTDQGTLASQIAGGSEFKPFTVKSGVGTATMTPTGLTLSDSALQQGLTGQAQTALQGLGQGVPDTSNLASQAFTGSTNLLGADSGAFASGLGGMYGALGEQQITDSQAPSNLTDLQNLFAQQAGVQQAGSLGGLTGQLQQAASGALGQATPTAESVYNQIRTIQTPEEERQRMALENRLAAQGRLGVTTSAYGGTPEQLALEKAQAEARNMASLQAMQTADQLASSQQQRAAQMAQLGMSAEQIEDQLQSSALQRGLSSGQLAGQLAQTGAGIQAQQQQLGQGLLGLGLQAQQLGGQLSSQDIANAQALFGLGAGASGLEGQLEAQDIQNLTGLMTASGIPLQQQLAVLGSGLNTAQLAQAGQLAGLSALGSLGTAELGMLKDLGLGQATLDQELLRSIGTIFAGSEGGN
jgi:hypothetical protein